MTSNRKIILLVGFVAILTRRQCFDWKNIIWLSKQCFCTYICLPVTDCWLDECGPMPRNFGGAQKNLFCPLLKTKKMYIFCLLVRRTVQQFYQSRRVFFFSSLPCRPTKNTAPTRRTPRKPWTPLSAARPEFGTSCSGAWSRRSAESWTFGRTWTCRDRNWSSIPCCSRTS